MHILSRFLGHSTPTESDSRSRQNKHVTSSGTDRRALREQPTVAANDSSTETAEGGDATTCADDFRGFLFATKLFFKQFWKHKSEWGTGLLLIGAGSVLIGVDAVTLFVSNYVSPGTLVLTGGTLIGSGSTMIGYAIKHAWDDTQRQRADLQNQQNQYKDTVYYPPGPGRQINSLQGRHDTDTQRRQSSSDSGDLVNTPPDNGMGDINKVTIEQREIEPDRTMANSNWNMHRSQNSEGDQTGAGSKIEARQKNAKQPKKRHSDRPHARQPEKPTSTDKRQSVPQAAKPVSSPPASAPSSSPLSSPSSTSSSAPSSASSSSSSGSTPSGSAYPLGDRNAQREAFRDRVMTDPVFGRSTDPNSASSVAPGRSGSNESEQTKHGTIPSPSSTSGAGPNPPIKITIFPAEDTNTPAKEPEKPVSSTLNQLLKEVD